MLKIKKHNGHGDKNQKALREVVKQHQKPLYALVDETLHRKLKRHLFNEGIPYVFWLEERIREI